MTDSPNFNDRQSFPLYGSFIIVQLEIFTKRKFSSISQPALIGEKFIHDFFLLC